MASLMRPYQIASSTLKKRCGIEPKKVSYIVQNLKRFRIRFNSRNHFRFGTDHSEKFEKVSRVNIKQFEKLKFGAKPLEGFVLLTKMVWYSAEQMV